MKKKLMFIPALLLLIGLLMPAFAFGFKNVVVFGDSLSDNGNIFAVSGGLESPPPNVEGRYSDGPVWVEYLVEELGLKGHFLNYAHGGARSGETNTNDGDTMTFPGFLTEVNSYLTQAPLAAEFPNAFALPADSLFIIWIGANDFLFMETDPASVTANAIANIKTALDSLVAAGAKEFLLVNIPNIGAAPKFNADPVLSAGTTMISKGFNDALSTLLDSFTAENTEADVLRLDTFSIMNEIIGDPAAFGFTNVTETKLDLETGDVTPGNYLFWDGVHPTTRTHRIIAQRAVQLIECGDCTGRTRATIGKDLTLTIPFADLDETAVGFSLIPYDNPAEEGLFWRLDMESIDYK